MSLGYNALGDMVEQFNVMSGVPHGVRTSYDPAGRRNALTHPDGQRFTYGYDAASRLTSIRHNGGDLLAAYSFHSAGQPGSIYHGQNAFKTTFGQDGANRLSTLIHTKYGSSYDVRTDLAYNPADEIMAEQLSNQSYAVNLATGFSRTYQANGLNQYSAVGGVPYTYDVNGNLQTDGTFAYTYDVENRLVAKNNGVRLRYDPLGRLFEITDANGNIRRHIYDGDELIAEYDANNLLLRRYVHGGGAGDDPIVAYSGATVSLGTARFLYTDHQGSVVLQADVAGSSVATYAYDEWGLHGSGQAPPRFGYTGQLYVPELGLYYYKARMYSPQLGRFLQTDPIGYGDGMNLYRYVGNDPVNGIDPSGMCVLKKGGAEKCPPKADPNIDDNDEIVVTGSFIASRGAARGTGGGASSPFARGHGSTQGSDEEVPVLPEVEILVSGVRQQMESKPSTFPISVRDLWEAFFGIDDSLLPSQAKRRLSQICAADPAQDAIDASGSAQDLAQEGRDLASRARRAAARSNLIQLAVREAICARNGFR